MRVLFVRDVKNVGRRGEVREVADGYATNFLIPRGLATPATGGVIRETTLAREREAAHAENRRAQLLDLTRRKDIVLEVKTGKRGEVFSSVTARDIEERLAREGYEGFSVTLTRPLKTTGAHEVNVSAGKNIEGTLTIEVRPSRP